MWHKRKYAPMSATQRVAFDAWRAKSRGLLEPHALGYRAWSPQTQRRWDKFWKGERALYELLDFLRGSVNMRSLSDTSCARCKSQTCPYIRTYRRERLAKEAA